MADIKVSEPKNIKNKSNNSELTEIKQVLDEQNKLLTQQVQSVNDTKTELKALLKKEDTNKSLITAIDKNSKNISTLVKELQKNKLNKTSNLTEERIQDEQVRSSIKTEIDKYKLEEYKEKVAFEKERQERIRKQWKELDDLRKKEVYKRSTPYKAVQAVKETPGGPISSTLLSLLTGGIINPVVANAFDLDKMFKAPFKALGKKALNSWQTRKEKANAEKLETSDNLDNDKENKKLGRTVKRNEKGTLPKLLTSKHNDLKSANDNTKTTTLDYIAKDKKRTTSAIDKATDNQITSRLDLLLANVKTIADNYKKNKDTKKEDKGPGIFSKIFGLLGNLITGAFHLMKNIGSFGLNLLSLATLGTVIRGTIDLFVGLKNAIMGLTTSALNLAKSLGNKILNSFSDSEPDLDIDKDKNNKDKNNKNKKNNNTKKNTKKVNSKKPGKIKKPNKVSAIKNIAKDLVKNPAVKTTTKTVARGLAKGAKVLGPAAMVADAAFVANDVIEAGGFANYGKQVQAEVREKSALQNLAGTFNIFEPEKMMFNFEELIGKGIRKLFEPEEQKKYIEEREKSYDRVLQKIEELYDNPAYRDKNNLFSLNLVEKEDRGMAYDFINYLSQGDPLAAATLTNDYIQDPKNFEAFYKERMKKTQNLNNYGKMINNNTNLQSTEMPTEYAVYARANNQAANQNTDRLEQSIINNNNNLTSSQPTIINNNVNVLPEPNVYASGPAAQTLYYR